MGCGSSKTVTTSEPENANKPSALGENVNPSLADNSLHDKPTIVVENSTIGSELPTDDETRLSLGDRVHVLGYVGTIRFTGTIDYLGQGKWIGIELDHKHRQGNDGSVNGVQYFSCQSRHGMFVRPTAVFHHTDVDTIIEVSKISPETIAFIQTNMRRFITKIRLRKFQQRSGTEKEIDALVLKTPKEETETVERLGIYLTSSWEGDRSKAYAVFRWVSLNVNYDVDGFFGRSEKQSGDAESVLRHKLAVCAGYTNLFEALAKVAGLEVYSVNGYAKGYGYEPGQQFREPNHAWNILKVNGEWFACDSTWGAGFIGVDLLFQRRLSMAMFLMDPEFAIHSHLPVDDKWQLLDEPVTKEQFEKLVVPSGKFHEMGVELMSHKEGIYEVDADHIDMIFYSPSLGILRASLKDSSGKDVEGRKRTQLLPCGANQVKLRAQFPAKGKYKLNLYVTDRKVDSKWHQGVEYIIHTTNEVGKDHGGFPQLGNNFYTEGFHLDQPLENIVSQDGKAVISLFNFSPQIFKLIGNLKLEGNEKAPKQEFEGFSFCFSEKTENGFKVKVHLPIQGNYFLKVFAKHFEEGSSDSFVCGYYINALSGLQPMPGFPRTSETFEAWGLQVVEPRENIYSRDGRASVQLRSAGDVTMVGYLAKGKQNLDPGLTISQEKEGLCTILAHTPDAGVYKLNIFGRKNGSKDSEYLATFMVKSEKASNNNPGFPYLKDEFKLWGLELVDHFENITSRDSQVVVTFANPKGIVITSWLFDDRNQQIGGPCAVESIDRRTVTTCELPAKGLFKLNVFGVNHSIDNTKQVYLCTYKILYSV